MLNRDRERPDSRILAGQPMNSVDGAPEHVTSVATARPGPWWSGDPSKAPRCGAKTRRGTPCKAPAMWSTRTRRYTRCRLHGGKSTGPKTLDGLEKCRRANWKHGNRSLAVLAERRAFRCEVRRLVQQTKELEKEVAAWLRTQRHLR